MIQIGKHIYVVENAPIPSRKTKFWVVRANDGEVDLGTVKWFGKWRCYAYFPLDETLYEKTCLRDLADFCETQTRLQLRAAKGVPLWTDAQLAEAKIRP